MDADDHFRNPTRMVAFTEENRRSQEKIPFFILYCGELFVPLRLKSKT